MDQKIKNNLLILLNILFLLFIIYLGINKLNEINQKLNESNKNNISEIKKITKGLIEISLSENKKEFNNLLEEIKKESPLQIKEIKNNKETIKEITKVISSLPEEKYNIESTKIINNKDDKQNKEEIRIDRKDDKNNILPMTMVSFYPNKNEKEKWLIHNYQIDYKISIIETETEEGKNKQYIELWAENKSLSEFKDKKFPIEITSIKWEKNNKKDKSFKTNLRIGLTTIFGINNFFSGLDISLFSYGKTKRDIDWRFLSLYIGGNTETFSYGLTPLSYNIGNYIPLIENLFIGPTISSDNLDNINYGLNISVPF